MGEGGKEGGVEAERENPSRGGLSGGICLTASANTALYKDGREATRKGS